ncbi:MAG: HAD-IA family hydrolase [Alphaproteobacteria bacterium]|nr:HAD-IA family hydrolase [Alphaproteobacteria bacterium]MBV9552844.1 HAD-IA family hydrolase [Alphaproteobacteria bacterium]
MTKFLLLFDLDGTLVDSVPDLCEVLNLVLREHGYGPLSRDAVRPMVGDGVVPLVLRGFAACGGSEAEARAALPHYIALYEANATRYSRLYPGVRETLRALRAQGYRTAVCTNKLQAATRSVLRGFEIDDLFDGIAGGDRYPVRKPDPGHLTLLIEELGGEAGRAALIGDSEIDAATARAASIPALLMSYGYARVPLEELGARRILDAFDQLPAALVNLGFAP